MSIADSDSHLHPAPEITGGRPTQHAHSGVLWLNGEVLACACPTCGAPMSIRLWLMLADCWQCGTSTELTEEQIQQAQQLLAAAQAAPLAQPQPQSQPVARAPAQPIARPRPAVLPLAQPVAPAARIPTARRAWGSNFDRRDLPCWLVSILLHMVIIILLGIWAIEQHRDDRAIVLASEVNGLDQPGDARVIVMAREPVEFDQPDKQPLEPRIEVASMGFLGDTSSILPPLEQPPGDLLPAAPSAPVPDQAGGWSTLLAGRDPRVRSQIALREGGTNETEAAVARGLAWLAAHQFEDGHWGLEDFGHAGDCGGRCGMEGTGRSDTGATALALLPFLGAGETHLSGRYQATVAKGVRWLMDAQEENRGLMGSGIGQMYAHGQATIVLCESYALTHDSLLRGPAQRAIDFIVAAQHKGGGWRYTPGEPGDTSVVGWQLMALRSAQMADLNVPPETLTRAMRYLDDAQTERSRGLYSYMPDGGPSPAMTAEGLLSRQYAGWTKSNPLLKSGVGWLLKSHLPQANRPDMYYWYYATQVMHHVGGSSWEEWNGRIRDILVRSQQRSGHEAGSWVPARSSHDRVGGRLYMTALATCTLEVYYRHMPLYRRQAAEKEDKSN